MSKWVEYYRVAQRGHRLEAKRAEGGEVIGHAGIHTVKKGQWLCRNPENNHMWSMSDQDFVELYCEVGKSPARKKIKKQEDGYKKGKSRKEADSIQLSSVSCDGKLFEKGNK